ncbi:MAG: hypothetical protein PVF26_11450 [Desulfobacterales bacterium]
MNIIKTDCFGGVESIRLGYGPIGPPLMSVFMYIVDSQPLMGPHFKGHRSIIRSALKKYSPSLW